ncbi:MAG: type II secretion system protein [Planctomycetota bacterium]|nr:type II secretion system protein [Planctomycetota bacterium]
MKRTPAPAVTRRASSRGFTIVELLVVIAVIAILLAILLPAYSKIMTEYVRHACRQNLEQIGKGLLTYAENPARGSNGDKVLPSLDVTTANWNSWASNTGNTNSLWLLVTGKLASPGNFVCPEARGTLGHKPAKYAGGVSGDSPGFSPTTCSYSYISQVGYRDADVPSTTTSGVCLQTIDTTKRVILLGDRNPAMELGLANVLATTNTLNHGDRGKDSAGKRLGGDGGNFYLLNQQTVWVEQLDKDKHIDDNPYMPETATDFPLGMRSKPTDNFLLQ